MELNGHFSIYSIHFCWIQLFWGPSLNHLISKTIISLRKHAYSNILKILPPKNENFQIKNADIFHISAQNIDCGYSLEHNLCFEAEIRKIMYTPVILYKSGV